MTIASLQLTAVAITSLLGAVIIILWFLGAFRRILFQEGMLRPFVFVYKTVQGPYYEIGAHFQEVDKFLTKHGMRNFATAGIYYDDPEKTKNPRSAVGFILPAQEEKQWKNVSEQEKKQWKVMNVKETSTVVSSFPMKWPAVSCGLSALKTYSAFKKEKEAFVNLKSGTMEIYSLSNGVIETYFPQSNVDQFNPRAGDWSTKVD